MLDGRSLSDMSHADMLIYLGNSVKTLILLRAGGLLLPGEEMVPLRGEELLGVEARFGDEYREYKSRTWF